MASAAPGSQTITFTSTAPTDATVGGPTYTPTATASSGLPVTLTIDSTTSANCSISGGVVSFTAAGSCTIDANQAGNASFSAAPQVQQTFTVASAVTTGAPIAKPDHYSTPINTKLVVPAPGVLTNDTLNGATIVSNTNPTHGSLTLNSDGSFTYTPHFFFFGVDSFTYTLQNSAGSSTAKVTIDVPARANLSVTLSAPKTAAPGSPFDYIFTVTNKGPDPASGVVAGLFLPPWVKVEGVLPSSTFQLPGVVAFSIGTLAPHQSDTYTIVVLANGQWTELHHGSRHGRKPDLRSQPVQQRCDDHDQPGFGSQQTRP